MSSFLLWGLGVMTAVWASVRSADDVRRSRKSGGEGDGSGVINYGGAREGVPVRM